jgi:hypothetical protein
MARAPQLCLLDSGALHNRFAAWVADAAGIDLTAADEDRLALGGFVTAARRASVLLTLGDVTWEPPYGSATPGLWRFIFSVRRDSSAGSTFARAAVYEIEITPEAQS